jgi:ankyrin repeat protein
MEIPKEKRQHAHRLFQCLVAAIRPLRVEELAEIFAIEFDQDATYGFMEEWRPEHPEEAILSACTTLITVIDNKDTKVVQFSHFSVKEFLTSEHLQTFDVRSIRNYHISLDAAHLILAQGCLTVLLQLDENTDKQRLQGFPLALYAAQHWYHHAIYEDSAPRVKGAMERLFDSSGPYLAAWLWIHDVVRPEFRPSIDSLTDRPSRPKESLLYYAIFCGHIGLCKYVIAKHETDVNAKYGTYVSLLHAVLVKGNLDAISILLDLGADVNLKNERKRTPLCEAYRGRGIRLEIMRLLLKRGASPDVWYDEHNLLLHKASYMGEVKVVRLLLQHNADPNVTASSHRTPLHCTSLLDVAQALLEYGADINALSDSGTPLFYSSLHGRHDIARLLIEQGADMNIQAPRRLTPLQVARKWGLTHMKLLLLISGAKDDKGLVASTDNDITLGVPIASADVDITLHTEEIKGVKGPVVTTSDGLHHLTLHAHDPFWFMDLVFCVMLWVTLTIYL